MKWVLYKGDTPISKSHSTRLAAIIEAFERKLVVTWRYGRYLGLTDGYSIKEGRS